MNTRRRLLSFLAVIVMVAACGPTASPIATGVPGTGVLITAQAGPTCPVERVPPDPACAPRPVAGATVDVLDMRGGVVATVTTDEAGTVQILLAPGDYVVQGRAANGLMGTAPPVNVTVVDGTLAPVVLAYDTGIR
jgi:hypothetical protein